jgi:hypothetical protein
VGKTGAGQVSSHGAILGYNTGLAMAAFCCWYITSPLGDDSLVGDFGIIVCSVVAQDQDLQNVDALYFKVWLNTSKVQ